MREPCQHFKETSKVVFRNEMKEERKRKKKNEKEKKVRVQIRICSILSSEMVPHHAANYLPYSISEHVTRGIS